MAGKAVEDESSSNDNWSEGGVGGAIMKGTGGIVSTPPSLYIPMWSMLHYRCIKPPKSH